MSPRASSRIASIASRDAVLTGTYIAARAAAELARIGEPVTLRRRQGTSGTFTDASIHGVLRQFDPDELTGSIRQGDAEVTIAHTPLISAFWPVPPRAGDMVVVGGRTWAVQGAMPKQMGGIIAAWVLWVRGG